MHRFVDKIETLLFHVSVKNVTNPTFRAFISTNQLIRLRFRRDECESNFGRSDAQCSALESTSDSPGLACFLGFYYNGYRDRLIVIKIYQQKCLVLCERN